MSSPIVNSESQHTLQLEKRLQDFQTCFRLLWPVEGEEVETDLPPLHYACKNGNLELVKLLLRGIPGDTVAEIESEAIFGESSLTPLMIAAKYGNVKIMSLLISTLPSNAIEELSEAGVPLLHFAAFGGLRSFNLIRNRLVGLLNREQLEHCAKAAASGGQIPLLQAIRTELKEDAFSALTGQLARRASSYGRLEVLKWLVAQQMYWEGDISPYAATNGHVHIIEWLQNEMGDSIDARNVVLNAVDGNQRGVLEILVLHFSRIKIPCCGL